MTPRMITDEKIVKARIRVLDTVARYAQVNGMLKEKKIYPQDLFGLMVAPMKVMTEETKAILRKDKPAPLKARKVGSGAFIRNLLQTTKLSHEEILKKLKLEFPDSKATVKDVKWNLAQLKKGKL